MLITDAYKQQNTNLHKSMPDYGKSSGKWVDLVVKLSSQYDCADILDYGCGKGLLKQGIGAKVKEYDPCIEGKTDKSPCDMLVCTDVMEHIEPDCLEAILDDLQAHTKKIAFITVSTRLARKILDDGRNAHLIVQPYDWWLPKFMSRFKIKQFNNMGDEFFLILEVKHA